MQAWPPCFCRSPRCSRAQAAFESIPQIVLLHGRGASGVGRRDRGFVVTDEGRGLRAEQGRMALEVVMCTDDGVAWAGRLESGGGARLARCWRGRAQPK